MGAVRGGGAAGGSSSVALALGMGGGVESSSVGMGPLGGGVAGGFVGGGSSSPLPPPASKLLQDPLTRLEEVRTGRRGGCVCVRCVVVADQLRVRSIWVVGVSVDMPLLMMIVHVWQRPHPLSPPWNHCP
jgi:hypothetical protein